MPQTQEKRIKKNGSANTNDIESMVLRDCNEKGYILLPTDAALLQLNDTSSRMKQMKKMPKYEYYKNITDNFLAMQPLIALKMDANQYLDYMTSKKFTPYNLELEETLCLAFTGFTYLYHYMSSVFGTYDLFAQFKHFLSDYKLNQSFKITNTFDRSIKSLKANSTLHGSGRDIDQNSIDQLQEQLEMEYVADTADLGDRLVCPLVDLYYNKCGDQNLPQITKYLDIIANNRHVWQFYYQNLIIKYGKETGYLANFKTYTYDRFVDSYVKITGKTVAIPETPQVEDVDPICEEEVEDISCGDIFDVMTMIADIIIPREESLNTTITTTNIDNETEAETEIKDMVQDLLQIVESAIHEESQLCSLQNEEAEDIIPETVIDLDGNGNVNQHQSDPHESESVVEVENDVSHIFNNIIYYDLQKIKTFSYNGKYYYGVYITGPFEIHRPNFKSNQDAFIYISLDLVHIYVGDRYEVYDRSKRLRIITGPDTKIQYVKIKKRMVFDPGNVVYTNVLTIPDLDLGIIENVVLHKEALTVLEYIRKMLHFIN